MHPHCADQRLREGVPEDPRHAGIGVTDTDTNRATLATTISGGSATPDVFMGDVIWPAQFGAHELALPLSNYLPASYFAQFAPGLIQGATYKGKVYGSPPV